MNLLDLLFPKNCLGCGEFGQYFCNQCRTQIIQGDLICPFCERLSLGGLVHPICKRKYGLDGLWYLGNYQGILRKAIHKLKYKGVSKLSDELIDLILEYLVKYQPLFLDRIKKDLGENWVIIPVPLYTLRQNWRGYNQSALLGKILADKIGLKYLDCLKRVRFTKPQVKLDSSERRKNIKDAFALAENYKLQAINCILIDDVWTTGATLKECCYVLKRSGVSKVWALTLAR